MPLDRPSIPTSVSTTANSLPTVRVRCGTQVISPIGSRYSALLTRTSSRPRATPGDGPFDRLRSRTTSSVVSDSARSRSPLPNAVKIRSIVWSFVLAISGEYLQSNGSPDQKG